MNLLFISQDFWFLKVFLQERLPGILLVLFLQLQFLLGVGMFYVLHWLLCILCVDPVSSCSRNLCSTYSVTCPKVAWTFHCCPWRDLWWSQRLNVPNVQQKHRWNFLVNVCAVEKRFSSCLTTGTESWRMRVLERWLKSLLIGWRLSSLCRLSVRKQTRKPWRAAATFALYLWARWMWNSSPLLPQTGLILSLSVDKNPGRWSQHFIISMPDRRDQRQPDRVVAFLLWTCRLTLFPSFLWPKTSMQHLSWSPAAFWPHTEQRSLLCVPGLRLLVITGFIKEASVWYPAVTHLTDRLSSDSEQPAQHQAQPLRWDILGSRHLPFIHPFAFLSFHY